MGFKGRERPFVLWYSYHGMLSWRFLSRYGSREAALLAAPKWFDKMMPDTCEQIMLSGPDMTAVKWDRWDGVLPNGG